MFFITMEHKSNCEIKICYCLCKILLIIFLLKIFIVKCLKFFLIPITSDKIESALKQLITSDLINTKIFVLYLAYFEKCLVMPINNDSITL